MSLRMPYDDVAWEKSEKETNEWIKKIRTPDAYRSIASFITKHRGGVAEQIFPPTRGGFNIHFKMKLDKFPEEKIRKEVAIIKLLQEKTSIPIPRIIHWGGKEESPLGIGPFIIMEYIEHFFDLVDALNTPGLSIQDRPILDPNIAKEKLEFVYGQIADILLQLSRISFPLIGAPIEDDVLVDKDFKVVAVIDWEFTYSAPVEFTYNPPFWLLLETGVLAFWPTILGRDL